MAKHKRVSMVLTVRVPPDMSAAQARREVRNWVNVNGIVSVAGLTATPRKTGDYDGVKLSARMKKEALI